jgi:hypothetical protein
MKNKGGDLGLLIGDLSILVIPVLLIFLIINLIKRL